jgi:predicted dehydrogenase
VTLREVNVGVVGLGRFGRLHARVLSELPGCRVKALCEVDEPTLERCGQEYGVRDLYTDLHSMLASEDLDAVDIVTDEASHGRQAMQCLEHGKAVFVEKPLATDGGEAEAVAALSREAGVPVVVGNISRFDARYALLRRELEAGNFGRVALVQAKRSFSHAWFAGFGSRVHPVFESMIHDLDLALWYLPAPVRRVYAQAGSTGDAEGVPNTLIATLTAEDGAIAVLQSTWLVPDAAPITLAGPPAGPLDLWGTIDAQLEIVGTSQVGGVDLMSGGLSLWNDSSVRAPDTGLWPEVHGKVSGALREELAHFLDCARTGKPSPIAPPETAAVAVRLAEAIVRSSREGEAVAFPGDGASS